MTGHENELKCSRSLFFCFYYCKTDESEKYRNLSIDMRCFLSFHFWIYAFHCIQYEQQLSHVPTTMYARACGICEHCVCSRALHGQTAFDELIF